MSRFRKRIGEAGAEELLSETIAAGLKLKAIKPPRRRCGCGRMRKAAVLPERFCKFLLYAHLLISLGCAVIKIGYSGVLFIRIHIGVA